MNKLVYWMVFPTFLATQPLSDSSQPQIPLTSDSSYTSQIGTQDHFFVSIPSNPNVYQPIVTYSCQRSLRNTKAHSDVTEWAFAYGNALRTKRACLCAAQYCGRSLTARKISGIRTGRKYWLREGRARIGMSGEGRLL